MQLCVLVNLLIDNKFKLKVRTQRTSFNSREEDNFTIPFWVIWAISPIGNLTDWEIGKDLSDNKRLESQTIWSEAPVLIIYVISCELKETLVILTEVVALSMFNIDSNWAYCSGMSWGIMDGLRWLSLLAVWFAGI